MGFSPSAIAQGVYACASLAVRAYYVCSRACERACVRASVCMYCACVLYMRVCLCTCVRARVNVRVCKWAERLHKYDSNVHTV